MRVFRNTPSGGKTRGRGAETAKFVLVVSNLKVASKVGHTVAPFCNTRSGPRCNLLYTLAIHWQGRQPDEPPGWMCSRAQDIPYTLWAWRPGGRTGDSGLGAWGLRAESKVGDPPTRWGPASPASPSSQSSSMGRLSGVRFTRKPTRAAHCWCFRGGLAETVIGGRE